MICNTCFYEPLPEDCFPCGSCINWSHYEEKKNSCPCDNQSKDECQICNDQKFTGEIQDLLNVIRDQKTTIDKQEYDIEVMKGILYVIRTVITAND